MNNKDIDIEKEIQEKNLTAPRVTPERLEQVIKSEEYSVFDGDKTTICRLTLENGFNIVGKSFCVCPENFDIGLGVKISRDDAVSQIWVLEGYLLQQKLYEA